MRATPRRLLRLATLLAASASALPQSSIPRRDGTAILAAQVDATVNQLLQAAHVTGAGIAIFHNPASFTSRPTARATSGATCRSHPTPS